jgi:site-specific recombinase XerC
MATTKQWSKMVSEYGVTVRLYQHPNGTIYRSVALERVTTANGHARTRQDRRSMKTRDRTQAETWARQLCKAIAEQRLTGTTPETLTLAQLHAAYIRECGALLSADRRAEVDKDFRLWRRHLGDGFKVADLGPHQAATYEAARRAGTLAATGGRHGGGAVRAASIAKELGVLRRALIWAETYRHGGRPLINRNPLRGVPFPTEPNPTRPVTSRERFDRLLAVADEVDASGTFRVMLVVAWATGRRLGSISALRASDVLLTPEAVAAALAEAGGDERLATEWPAAIRWAAEADKEGVAWLTPIPTKLAATLAAYIRARALVGNAVLFSRTRGAPVSHGTSFNWMRAAERKAKLPRQTRGGWHAIRRAWATARKHMPLQDVMLAGGWRDATSLQRAYQHADPATVRAVMEVGA